MTTFKLPQNGEVFVSEVFQRCEGLIETGIWNGVAKTRFLQWLTNFHNDVERYFAACVLDALIYRSEAQTLSLVEHLFQRVLPDLSVKLGWTRLVGRDWNALLSDTVTDPGVRLVAVAKKDHPPLKSSYAILRLMKRHFRVHEKWTTAAWNLVNSGLSGDTSILFIDDFLGTGEQFESFYAAEDVLRLVGNRPQAYVPLVGFLDGVKHLEQSISQLRVQPVELLTNRHRLFHAESECFTDGTNSSQDAETFYYDLLKSRTIPLSGDERRGFGGLELAYAFQHAAPDNCLPILWFPDSPQWIPLFDR